MSSTDADVDALTAILLATHVDEVSGFTVDPDSKIASGPLGEIVRAVVEAQPWAQRETRDAAWRVASAWAHDLRPEQRAMVHRQVPALAAVLDALTRRWGYLTGPPPESARDQPADRVLHHPQQKHRCATGVTYHPITEAETHGEWGFPPSMIGMSTASPADPWKYPPGTLWQCDTCGRIWEAYHLQVRGRGGVHLEFRRLGPLRLWWLRWRGRA